MPARMALEAVGAEVWDAYYRFAVERNPWDAVVSAYYWSFREREAPPFEEWVVEGDQVDNLAKNAGIYRLQGDIAVHRVIRYESLDAEVAEVWAHLGLPGTPDLPHAKSGTRPRDADYRSMYTDVSRTGSPPRSSGRSPTSATVLARCRARRAVAAWRRAPSSTRSGTPPRSGASFASRAEAAAAYVDGAATRDVSPHVLFEPTWVYPAGAWRRTAPDPLSHFLARADRAGLSTHPLLTDARGSRAGSTRDARCRRPRAAFAAVAALRAVGTPSPERAARGQRRRPRRRRASGRSRGGCAASTARTPGTTRPWRSSSSSGRTPTGGWPCWSPCRCRAPGSPRRTSRYAARSPCASTTRASSHPPWPWLHHLVARLEDPAVGRVGPLLVERDQTVVAAAALPASGGGPLLRGETPADAARMAHLPVPELWPGVVAFRTADGPRDPAYVVPAARVVCDPSLVEDRSSQHRLETSRPPAGPLARGRVRRTGSPAACRRGPAGAALGDRHRRAAGTARAPVGRRPVRAQPRRRPRAARPAGHGRPSRDARAGPRATTTTSSWSSAGSSRWRRPGRTQPSPPGCCG